MVKSGVGIILATIRLYMSKYSYLCFIKQLFEIKNLLGDNLTIYDWWAAEGLEPPTLSV